MYAAPEAAQGGPEVKDALQGGLNHAAQLPLVWRQEALLHRAAQVLLVGVVQLRDVHHLSLHSTQAILQFSWRTGVPWGTVQLRDVHHLSVHSKQAPLQL